MASYLLGNSIMHFSLVIGTYLSAMGVGAWLSRFIERGLLARFVEIEIVVALIGGFEAPILFGGFAVTPAFSFLLYGIVFVVGTLVGLELPLLIRLLEQHTTLKDLVSRVLFLDYIGALCASVLFPLVLVPQLGLFRTSLAFGLLNAAVALWATFLFDEDAPVVRLRVMAAGAITLLGVAFIVSPSVEAEIGARLFADPVVFADRSPYQSLVVTNQGADTRLFINGALQFSSVDEHRYHEALVHPAMSARAARGPVSRVLVLGGGDGLAVREVLKWPGVEHVVLVDLDPKVTQLFRDRPELAALNDSSLSDSRVQVVNDDAFIWLRDAAGLSTDVDLFDVVIIDFPDPNDYGLGKLYTTHFYRLVARWMAPGAVFGLQATSPLFSPNAYWCIVETIAHEGFEVRPYHAYVPAFGEWGFALASKEPLGNWAPLPDALRFLDLPTLETLFHFPRDMAPREVPINRLDNQVLVRLYEQDWVSMGAR